MLAFVDGGGAANFITFEGGSSGGGGVTSLSSIVSALYNSALDRYIVPDFINIGVGFNGIAGVGGGTSIELNWITHGPDASFFLL
ncbi:hypothetical protein EG849_15035 [Flavobacterium macacae]|uniref:Uncharacterized protein n=2 Tax=Flavobacterium macacae TaxID=2488993 RepID=A0A3P3W1K9_9FLAO|nr:hypothetical protein EG849_15035 [Flavobacterium macacae]